MIVHVADQLAHPLAYRRHARHGPGVDVDRDLADGLKIKVGDAVEAEKGPEEMGDRAMVREEDLVATRLGRRGHGLPEDRFLPVDVGAKKSVVPDDILLFVERVRGNKAAREPEQGGQGQRKVGTVSEHRYRMQSGK